MFRLFLSTLSLRRATTMTTTIYTASKFLSTLSLRRATGSNESGENANNDFYPRSPCGERHQSRAVSRQKARNFYPRSPCGERPYVMIIIISIVSFLSTLSLRRATFCQFRWVLLVGNFYPRSPCGERQGKHHPVFR